MISSTIKLLRPEQWVKNLLLFLPAFFAQNLLDPYLLLDLMLGFIAFCFVASSVYIINDIHDREMDINHPVKSHRAIASGKVKVSRGIEIAILLLILAILLVVVYRNAVFIWLILAYFLINLFYTYLLKEIPILDLFILAIGFLIRIFAGGAIANVPISKWLVIMIFLGALMIGLGKRRDELLLFESDGKSLRGALKGYSKQFIDVALIFVASITTVAYIMYTISDDVIQRIGNDDVYLTGFFVVLGMMKYLQLVFVKGETGQPTILFLKNNTLRLIILLWVITFSILLYFE